MYYTMPFDVFCYVLRPKLSAPTVIAFEQSTLYHRGLVHTSRQKRASKFGYVNELVYKGIKEKIQPYYRLKLMLEDAKSSVNFTDIKIFWTDPSNAQPKRIFDQPYNLHSLNCGPIVPYALIKCALVNTQITKYLYAPKTMLNHSVFYVTGARGTGATFIAKCLASTFIGRTIFVCSDFFTEVDDWKKSMSNEQQVFPTSIEVLYNIVLGTKFTESLLVVVFDCVLEYVDRSDRLKVMELFKVLRDMQAVIIVTSQENAKNEGTFRSAVGSNDMPYVNIRTVWAQWASPLVGNMISNNRNPAMYSECYPPKYIH